MRWLPCLALLVCGVGPALAASSSQNGPFVTGDEVAAATTTSLFLNYGDLTIDAPASASYISVQSMTGGTATAALNGIQISNLTGQFLDYTVEGRFSTLVGLANPGMTIDAHDGTTARVATTSVTVSPGTVIVGSVVAAAPASVTNLGSGSGGVALANATNHAGSFTLDANLQLDIPIGRTAQIYQGTVRICIDIN